MIPDLFSGSAAASAAAWPTAAAGTTDPAAQSETPYDAFADLLAATIAPQADSALPASGAAPRNVALPVSLPDLWLGLAMAVSPDGEIPEEAVDGQEAFSGEPDDEAPIEASSSVPVAAAESAVAVPIIVQVPTGIMSAAPVQEHVSTAQPVGRDVTPRQDGPAGPEGVPTVNETPQDAAPQKADAPVSEVAGRGLTPRQDGTAGREGPPDVTKAQAPRESVEAGREGSRADAERAVPAAPRADVPAAADVSAVAVKNTPAPRAVAAAPVSVDTQSVGADTKPANADAKAVGIETKAANVETKARIEVPRATSDAPASVPVDAAPEQQEADAVGGNDLPRATGREGAPSSSMTGKTPLKPAQTAADQVQAQAPAAAPVTTTAPLEQAAQIALQAAAVRGVTPRQDDAAGSEDVTEGGAAVSSAAQGVAAAAASQQGGDASQNGAGQQPSPEGARDIPAAARAADQPVTTSSPVAVTTTEAVAKPAMPAAAALPPFTPAQEIENMDRLVESMRVQWRQGVPQATIRLNPEHLGEITISIRVDRGVVSATFRAETPAVQQWLEAQEEKLRSGLADQGLNLERYVVQRERQQQERRDQRPQQQQARYRQPQEPGQRFEVTV